MSLERAIDLFTTSFGARPRVVASAPGRVNLIGEHTDYNGGEVLPMAIALRTWVAMAPSSAPRSRAVSAQQAASGEFDLSAGIPAGRWWDYVHGALREIGCGTSKAVDVAVVSAVPEAAGLSSSAALEVATALAGAVALTGSRAPDLADIAMAGHRAETSFVGVGCGIMDQSASACAVEGRALRLWCDTGRRQHVPFAPMVLIIDTMTPRSLRSSAYSTRVAECAEALAALRTRDPALEHLAHASVEAINAVPMPDASRRRARHVVTETRRVGEFVRLAARDQSLRAVMQSSHQSLRDDYECSSPELDWVVEFAHQVPGIDGARMTGAGWGGCAIAIGTGDALHALAEAIGPAYRHTWGREPRTWMTGASAGARLEWTADA